MKQVARGFTLIELTLVLGLVVIVSGLVITRMGSWSPRHRVISAANTVGNTLSFYRELARNEEKLYAIVFEPESHQLKVYAPQERHVAALVPSALIKTIAIPNDVDVHIQGASNDAVRTVFLDAKGVLPPMTIQAIKGEHSVRCTVDPLLNKVAYEAP